MNRKEVVAFCNQHIFPKVIEPWNMNRQDMINTIKAVSKYRIGKPADMQMHAEIVNNFLYINNEPVTRITAAPPKPVYSEKASYYETLCIKDY